MVVEPEPAEYVRICDAYGAGFFYIPGTETCMKFSGYVRTHYAGASAEREFSPAGSITGLIGFTPTGADSGPDFQSFLGENESANTWNTRARFDIDTRSETEFGTLRALIRLQSSSASDDGSNSDFEVDKAVISLGGLRAGISDSLFNANFAVVNVAGLASVNTLFGAIGDDASYGFLNAHIADYTINIGDFSISGGVEDSNGANATNASFLAKVEYAADTLIVGAVGERESDEDIAYKIYGNYDLSEFIPGGIIGGWYMGEEIESGSTDNNSTARLGVYDSIWGIGFQMDVTDNVEFFALHSQLNDGTGDVRYSTSDAGGAAITTDAGYAGDTQTTTVGVNWYPADGLKVFGSYTIASSEANFTDIVPATAVDHTVESDSDLFVIGLRRSF